MEGDPYNNPTTWPRWPGCLAVYFTWPQVTVNRHARRMEAIIRGTPLSNSAGV